MKKTNLLYHTFTGGLREATIQPVKNDAVCTFQLTVLENDEVQTLKLTFADVAALEYSVNFMDTASEEKGGFYKVPGKKQKRKLLERNCKRRNKEWVMSRLRDGEKADDLEPADQEELDALEEQLAALNLYLLETRRGAWLVMAKNYECVTLEGDEG